MACTHGKVAVPAGYCVYCDLDAKDKRIAELERKLEGAQREDPRCSRCGCRGTIWDDGVCHGCHMELMIDEMRAALSRLVVQAELTTDCQESFGGTLHDAIRQARAILKGGGA